METNDNIEILVHVAAPCRGVDDVRYRALAQAYLDFKPEGRTKLSGGRPQRAANAIIPSSLAAPTLSQSTPFHASDPSSEATQIPPSAPVLYYPPDNSLGSSQLSFRSVLDNRNSPRLDGDAREPHRVLSSQPATQTQFTQASWATPPSVIGDSQPEYEISLAEFSTPSRLFEHLACQFESQSDDASPQTPLRSARRFSSFSVETEYKAGEYEEEEECEHEILEEDNDDQKEILVEGDEDDGLVVLITSNDPPATSVIPSPPLADNMVLDTPFPDRKQPQQESSPFNQVIQGTPCQPSKRPPPLHSSSRLANDPAPSPKRHKRFAPISESSSKIQVASSVIVGFDESANQTDVYHLVRTPNERHLNYLERLEIHPTGPPVGSNGLTPDDLLTPRLRELARQLNMSKRFRPVEQTRELRPFERGHWLLDWTGWRPTLRERAWHFLTDYVLDGYAGWGVWCMRAEDWSWLRVYCWGHVVGYVYLALYLASERALKMDTARWVDGAGEVIVITNGHENSECGNSS